VLAALVQTPGQIDSQAAMAFLMIGAVHVALMIMVLKVSGTMVSGWRVFGLVPDNEERGGMTALAPAPATVVRAGSPAASSSPASDRRIPVSSFAVAPAANDAGALGEGGRRETRVIARDIASGGAQVEPLMPSGASRARGIGSRFRAPAPRLSEKVK